MLSFYVYNNNVKMSVFIRHFIFFEVLPFALFVSILTEEPDAGQRSLQGIEDCRVARTWGF